MKLVNGASVHVIGLRPRAVVASDGELRALAGRLFQLSPRARSGGGREDGAGVLEAGVRTEGHIEKSKTSEENYARFQAAATECPEHRRSLLGFAAAGEIVGGS